MKKFSFPLEDVLKYRSFMQNQAEIELGKARAVEQEIQRKLDQIALQRITLEHQMKGSTNFASIADANNFYAMLDLQKEKLFKDMAEAKIISEQKRKILQDAMQKTDALQRLRDRQLDEWKQAENAEEEDVTDDIVTSRFKKNQ